MKTLYCNTLITLLFLCVGSSVLTAAQMTPRQSQEGSRSNTASPCPELQFDEFPESFNIFFDTKAFNGQQSREAITFRKSDKKNGVLYIPQSVMSALQGTTAHNSQSSSSAISTPADTRPLPSSTPDANAIAHIKELSSKLAALALSEAAQHTLSTPVIQTGSQNNPQSTSSASAAAAPEVASTPTAVTTEPIKSAPTFSSKQEEYLGIWTNRIKRSFVIKKTLNTTVPEDESLATRFEAICYEHGLEGKEKNSNESIDLYEKAAEQGDALSQTYLSINYLLLKRHKEALRLLIAASAKLDDAKILRAYCYQYGIGAEKNAELAQSLLATSASYQEEPEAVELNLEYLHDTIKLGL